MSSLKNRQYSYHYQSRRNTYTAYSTGPMSSATARGMAQGAALHCEPEVDATTRVHDPADETLAPHSGVPSSP